MCLLTSKGASHDVTWKAQAFLLCKKRDQSCRCIATASAVLTFLSIFQCDACTSSKTAFRTKRKLWNDYLDMSEHSSGLRQKPYSIQNSSQFVPGPITADHPEDTITNFPFPRASLGAVFSKQPQDACSYLPWRSPGSWQSAACRACAWWSAPAPWARSVLESQKLFPAGCFSSWDGRGFSVVWWARDCSSYPLGSCECKYQTVRRGWGCDWNTVGPLAHNWNGGSPSSVSPP